MSKAPSTSIAGLGAPGRKAVADALARALADTFLLSLKTHGFHWNVTGPHFSDLHKLFEAQYTEMDAAVDEIAERIRALGVVAPGSAGQFLKTTGIAEEAGTPSWRDMVGQLAAGNESASATARSGVKAAQEAGDEASADLLIGRIDIHDKNAWMLRSILA